MLPVIQFVQQALQKLIADLPTHLAHKALEIGAEHRREASSKRDLEKLSFTISGFLHCVSEQRYTDAINLVAPDFQKILQAGSGPAANLEKLHKRLLEATDLHLSALEFESSNTQWTITGSADYGVGRSAQYTITVVKPGNEWKVIGYRFEAPPPPPPAIIQPAPPKARSSHAGISPAKENRCPAGYPVKGSATGVYHLTGGRFYAQTRAVLCFRNEADAQRAGYRSSRRG